MSREMNRLWAKPTTAQTLEEVAYHPHAYGNPDHCLFIGPAGPEGSREVDDELREYLTAQDWRWIFAESDKISAEQMREYRELLEREREAFFKRFDAALEIAMAEESEREPEEENSARSAESE